MLLLSSLQLCLLIGLLWRLAKWLLVFFITPPSLTLSLSLFLSLPREWSALKDEQLFPVDLRSLVPISTVNVNNSRPHAKLKDTRLFFTHRDTETEACDHSCLLLWNTFYSFSVFLYCPKSHNYCNSPL